MTLPRAFRSTALKLVLSALAVAAFAASAAPPPADEAELLTLGFKELVATSKVQQDWVRSLPAGQIRAMQRTGKKYFIYPDAAKNRIFVGGPKENDAYLQLHPKSEADAQAAAKKASEYRGKQDRSMQAASARDLSNPFLGASWADLGW